MRQSCIILSLLILTGCAVDQQADDQSYVPRYTMNASSPTEAARSYYEEYLTNPDHIIVQAGVWFKTKHREEILETLEIVDVDTADISDQHPLSAVFVRYSIGTRIFRAVHWVRDTGDRWMMTYVSTHLDYDHPIRERADEWEDNSAEMYP